MFVLYIYTLHIAYTLCTYANITYIHTYRHACMHAYGQTDRQTDIHTYIHTYAHTHITSHYITLHHITSHYLTLHHITSHTWFRRAWQILFFTDIKFICTATHSQLPRQCNYWNPKPVKQKPKDSNYKNCNPKSQNLESIVHIKNCWLRDHYFIC